MQADVETPSANVYVLAEYIDASRDEHRLFTTLGIRRSGSGALLTLRVALRAMRLAADVHPSARAASWVIVTYRLMERVAQASASARWLGVHSPTLANRDNQTLSSPVRSKLSKDRQDRLNAWLGLHLFKALSLGTPLPAQVVDDWSTLLRSDSTRSAKATDWARLAAHMPLGEAELSSALAVVSSERAREALRKTLAALDADLPEPLDESNDAGPAGYDENGEDAAFPEHADDGAHVPPASEEDGIAESSLDLGDADNSGKRHSLIGWILRTAAYGGYRSHYGIPGLYGTLPPPDLRQTCRSLMRCMEDGLFAECAKVAAAEVSLKSSLPPKLALDIPLNPNGDLWLDLDSGAAAVVWNYRAVVDAPSKRDPASVCPVHIRLSDKTAEQLRRMLALIPTARTLGDLLLLSGRVAREEWLKAYGLFLRGHGDDLYKAYSARFASSYHGVFHARHHGPVFAAFLSLDFSAIPPGLMHYLNIPVHRLTACQRDVDDYLGFAWTDVAVMGDA